MTACLLGSCFAFWAASKSQQLQDYVTYVLALAAAVPGIVFSSAMLSAADRVGGLSQGVVPTVLVLGMLLAPVTALVSLVSIRTLCIEEVQAAILFMPPSRAFYKVILPLLVPGFAAGLAIAFLLSSVDFTTSSLFGESTSLLDLYARVSSGDPILGASIPFLCAGILMSAVAGRWLSSLNLRGQGESAKFLAVPRWIAVGTGVAAGLAAAAYALFAMLIFARVQNLGTLWSVWQRSGDDLGTSTLIALCCGALVTPLAIVGGPFLASSRSWFLWTLALAPAAFPPALVGIAWARAANQMGLEGILVPAVAHTMRFAPLASLICAIWWMRQPTDLHDAARLFLPPIRRWARVTLPLIAPSVAAAFLLTGVLSLGELGASLLVIPPGLSTLTIRLYNDLHYGSAASTSAVTLLLVFAPLLPGIAAWQLWRRTC